MKRTKAYLEGIKTFVDATHRSDGNKLILDVDKPYDPAHSELGYCFKFVNETNGSIVYKICCSKTGIEHTDYRVMMHEYGHIYLGHLDGIHEELDSQIKFVIENNRSQLVASICQNTGLDENEALGYLHRIIDDPYLNHSLHNIAMDMEVNSSVLSKEDIEEMEMDITKILPNTQEEAFKWLADQNVDEEVKKEIQKELDKLSKEAKIKFILPERYNFPNDLTYAEYLLMIIQHPDLFIKMLVSIDNGGNGDVNSVTKQMIQQALNQKFNNKSDEYKKGYQQAYEDFKNKQNNSQNQQGQQNQNQQGQQGQQNGQQGQPQNGQQQGQQSGQQANQQGGQQGGQPQDQGQQGQGQGQGQQGQGQGLPQNGQGGQSQGQGGQSQGQGQSGQGSNSDDYNQGYQDALNDIANGMLNPNGGQGLQGLNQLMQNSGLSPDPGQKKGEGDPQQKGGKSPWNGQQSRAGSGDKDLEKDHFSDSRKEADEKRAKGLINSSQHGCGKTGGPDSMVELDKSLDDVDTAIKEVLDEIHAKTYKKVYKRNVMRNYNRGIQRSVIAPSIQMRNSVSVDPKLVFLIDVSGSMNTYLINRVINSISNGLKKINRGLKYDIITWSTYLGEHLKDIDPRKSVPRISSGGGTDMASGIEYFKNNYKENATLIIISDFCDSLDCWHNVEMKMSKYSIFGWNYGRTEYDQEWTNLKQRNFSNYGYD